MVVFVVGTMRVGRVDGDVIMMVGDEVGRTMVVGVVTLVEDSGRTMIKTAMMGITVTTAVDEVVDGLVGEKVVAVESHLVEGVLPTIMDVGGDGGEVMTQCH